jgi:hypothetical protein
MRIESFEIPQADRLSSVVQAIIAVGKGARTDRDIIANIPDLTTARQGRYYRNASEILGFITNYRNNASLTLKGEEFLKNPSLKNPLFIASVLNIEVIQRLLPYLELKPNGLTKPEIESYIESIVSSDIGESMIPRRILTILSWLKTLNVLVEKNGKYYVQNTFTNDLPVFEISNIEQPILPVSGDLKEYEIVEKRVKSANEIITIYKDQAKLDRANNVHTELVNLVANRISKAGGVPKQSGTIDLAVNLDKDFIFEMKSTTSKNEKSQINKGMGQLYEYRYLYNKPDANLVLVVENPLETKNSWMLDYLETDRNIHLVWDGNDQLYGTQNTREKLGFLELIDVGI